jgi:hypothetical protein
MMKKLILAALAAFTLTAAVTHDAHAVRIVTQDLQWRDQAGGAIRLQNLGVGINDTTIAFSTEGWALPSFATSASATVTDSLLVGVILLAPDSSAAYTPSASSATIIIEGGVHGVNDVNFSPMATTTFTDPTTTDKVWRIPIYINPWLMRGASAASPNLGNLWPVMRMRIVTIGGTFSACKASILRFAD